MKVAASASYLLAAGVVAVTFAVYLARPYSVVSDIGYQALAARQFADHYTTVFNSIRLVDPHDLAKDVLYPLTAWAPGWTLLFLVAFKTGLSAGAAGRVLAFLLSLTGALGWVRMISIVGLRGWWRVAGILLISVFCLRTGSVTKTGAGDQVIYAVAPWLLVASSSLAVPLSGGRRRGLMIRTALLALVLGSVYWLKYSGIFLSIAILAAVLIEQLRGYHRTHLAFFAAWAAIYSAAFVVPILGLKAYNYRASGTDFIESSAQHSPPRDVTYVTGLLSEAAYNAGTVLFSTGSGARRIAGEKPSLYGWLVRIPGLILLVVFFHRIMRRPPSYIRNVAILSAAIPLVAFPALSFLGGAHFSDAMERCCEPYWLLLELLILALLAQLPASSASDRNAWACLALATAFQVALFLWIPFSAAKDVWKIAHSPPYRMSAAELWDTDLSKDGTRDIDDRVRSLIRGPRDVIVPALYSNRAFATDTLLEFGGRLLPLGLFFAPRPQAIGMEGTNYNSSSPFLSSAPLRIILVAPDPYKRSDFLASTKRIMNRFKQVLQWAPGPADPNGRVWIWIGEVRGE